MAVSETRSPDAGEGYVCFPVPEPFRELPLDLTFLNDKADPTTDWQTTLLNGVSDTQLEGLTSVLHTLMCGEESAVNIFHHEATRVETDAARRETAKLLNGIAVEEAEHEKMLLMLQKLMPVPSDLEELRRRAKFFFMRVASRDPAVHFARIAALDGGVCITLKQMLDPSAALKRAPLAHAMLTRIWRDEARHVRISRAHSLDLGLDAARMDEEARSLRRRYAERIVLPLGDAWERIGVDAAKLVQRLIRSDEVDVPA